MRHRQPLKHILEQGRAHWDRNEVTPAVRRALEMAVQCRTAALGAEVYASEKQERMVYHTCKSRACASCGFHQEGFRMGSAPRSQRSKDAMGTPTRAHGLHLIEE